jgi:tRNA(fMet)-specific endonuclease VapC
MIDFLRGRSGTAALLNAVIDSGSAISAMTYGELWEGVVHNPRRLALVEVLNRLLVSLPVLALDEATMRHYGEIRSTLRRQGILIGAPDILIAATAVQHDLTLVTRNVKHFSRIPELQLAAPSDVVT